MSTNPFARGRLRQWVFTTLFVLAAQGCNSQSNAQSQATNPGAAAAPATTSSRSYNLTIYGYNYTDYAIGSFEVNGQGGGNLVVSSPTSAGGSSVCCASINAPMTHERTVTIKWSRDGKTWCEQEAILRPPLPPTPKYFEVHFYRDGHIELAVTERDSDPRLSLERKHPNSRHVDETLNVNNDSKFARCKIGYN
jgi:Protein of unknown function (DUF3304)